MPETPLPSIVVTQATDRFLPASAATEHPKSRLRQPYRRDLQHLRCRPVEDELLSFLRPLQKAHCILSPWTRHHAYQAAGVLKPFQAVRSSRIIRQRAESWAAPLVESPATVTHSVLDNRTKPASSPCYDNPSYLITHLFGPRFHSQCTPGLL